MRTRTERALKQLALVVLIIGLGPSGAWAQDTLKQDAALCVKAQDTAFCPIGLPDNNQRGEA